MKEQADVVAGDSLFYHIDSHAVKLLHSAQEATQRVNELREKKIDYQDTIIELLRELLQKSHKEI